MKNLILITILLCFVIILSACGPKAVEQKIEENTLSGEAENILEENTEEQQEEATLKPVVDLSKQHDVDYKMGTKEDPVKIGEYGLGTSLTMYQRTENGTYDYLDDGSFNFYDVYVKVTGRMTDEEVDDYMDYFRQKYPNKEIDEDFVFIGVNVEVDFNDLPDLMQAYILGEDQRLETLPMISIESYRYNPLNGLIIKATIDDEHIEDNHFQIIFSQYKEKDEHPLLKVYCSKTDTNELDEETYCYYEI